ncbi:MAG: hypothetical protein ACLQD8_06335 [Thermoplasmata archaeon]
MVELESAGIALSLALLSGVLSYLSIRGVFRSYQGRSRHQLMFALGLGCGAAAMAIELVAYLGVVNSPLLQGYVFLSAAIVGVLSLGSAKAFRPGRFEAIYAAYMVVTLGTVAWFSFTTPMAVSMVRQGIVVGNPPLLLLVLSSLVTVPATVVLLTAAVVHLRRTFRPKGLLMVAGACVLGAGGAFYIASFPVVLYYAEFVGILMLFLGLADLSRFAMTKPATAPDRVSL